jgi:hypothetical protein
VVGLGPQLIESALCQNKSILVSISKKNELELGLIFGTDFIIETQNPKCLKLDSQSNFWGKTKTRIEGLPEDYQQLTIGSNLDYIELDLIFKFGTRTIAKPKPRILTSFLCGIGILLIHFN